MTGEAMDTKEEFLSPRTPPSRNTGDEDDTEKLEDTEARGEDGLSNSGGKGRRRHRRAKGRKRKQKSSLIITNEDGSEFSGSLPVKQSKMGLRPTNPLLNAPRNSTQFIIDDHENSNLFWNFEVQRPLDLERGDGEVPGGYPGQYLGAAENERYSPDDECFWEAYSERDFEEVYETAHQEDVMGWEEERIVREIAAMEKRQNQLIELLASIDPIVYLEKLQGELLSLQEVNRELKLVNIAEKLHRQERMERGERDSTSDSDSRLPDSTSQEGEKEDGRYSEDEGGCSSGCCLKDPCDESCDLEQEMSEEESDSSDSSEGSEATEDEDGGTDNSDHDDDGDDTCTSTDEKEDCDEQDTREEKTGEGERVTDDVEERTADATPVTRETIEDVNTRTVGSGYQEEPSEELDQRRESSEGLDQKDQGREASEVDKQMELSTEEELGCDKSGRSEAEKHNEN